MEKTTNKFNALNTTTNIEYWYVEYFDKTGTVGIEVYINEAEADSAISSYMA